MLNKVYECENILNQYEIKDIHKRLLDHNWSIDTPYTSYSSF